MSHAAQIAVAVAEMQAVLCAAHAGLRARLLVRAGSGDEAATWMETYAHPGGIDDALAAEIERHALPFAALLAGARHVEAFSAASSP